MAEEKIRKYTNGEVTVVWKPDVCIHSTACWHGLGEVFKPKERPWIQLDKSTTDKIIAQVTKCPSGALSFYMNEVAPGTDSSTPVAESSHITAVVEVSANGPYLISRGRLYFPGSNQERFTNHPSSTC